LFASEVNLQLLGSVICVQPSLAPATTDQSLGYVAISFVAENNIGLLQSTVAVPPRGGVLPC
jgi:hypothetical protein